MKYLISYSGGLGSFYSAKLMVDKYGKDNVIAIFTDVGWEDEDLYRFIEETIKLLDIDLIYLKAPYKPLEVSEKENVIYNNRMGNCSKLLKMRLLKSFLTNKKGTYTLLREVFDLKDLTLSGFEHFGTFNKLNTTLILGIDWTEAHRTEAIKFNWNKFYNVEFPLVEDYTYSKQRAYDFLKENNIKIPYLYKLGFSHNNCGGRCIKAGQGHFKLLFDKLPERFEELKNFENKMREKIGKDVSIMKRTKDGTTKMYTLESLKIDIENRPEQIDLFDIGGCGCFLEEE